MDDMVVQGFGAIVIIYGGLIVIALGVVLFITKFWNALVSGDTGFILLWCCNHSCIGIPVYWRRSFTP